MSTPKELLAKRDELAQRVAERELERTEAVASLRVAAEKHPELLDKLAGDWADTEIDRSVKRYVARRNKVEGAKIARKLAELGMERPMLDGQVVPLSHEDSSYSGTLAEYGEYVDTNLASSRRLVKSFEVREEDHQVLVAAVDGNLEATREQAVDALKRLPEARRKALRVAVASRLAAKRREFMQRRYGDLGQAAEG